ncbi:MAG TPA: hypothetical protein VGO93_05430 [Candidatus Xenobia bacterium]|jgi:hypothetical protein
MARELKTLLGARIDEIHSSLVEPEDMVRFVFSNRWALDVPIDLLVPFGDHEWDDYWTDFEDFVADIPDDLEPEAIEGEVITLGELLEKSVVKVRTGYGSVGGRYVVLDLEGGPSLLMPADRARLDKHPMAGSPDFETLVDPAVTRQVEEEPEP